MIDNKNRVLQFIETMNQAILNPLEFDNFTKKFLPLFSQNIIVEATAPFEPMEDLEAHINNFWYPLLRSFPDLENQPYILIGGSHNSKNCVSLTGNMIGTFTESWLGIPPTQQPVWIRYATHFLFREDKIVKAWYFLDMLDVMRQAGFSFFPQRGVSGIALAPMTGDGLVAYAEHNQESKKSLELTDNMLNGLGSYDGKTLQSMGQDQFWDVDKMIWYGPGGIGITRGLKGFQRNHQVPFITAFPDRGITDKDDQDHFAQYGDGSYSCDFGFPAMYGTHLGDGWLGLEATGKKITLRVMDFWRREGNKLRENWVFIDMIDVLSQLGIDVFKLLEQKTKGKK